MDLLYDNGIPVVSLIGKAGSGKTLCAIASGLEQVIGQDPKYNRLKLLYKIT
jgi:PhoH-like ATPase